MFPVTGYRLLVFLRRLTRVSEFQWASSFGRAGPPYLYGGRRHTHTRKTRATCLTDALRVGAAAAGVGIAMTLLTM